MVVCLNIHTWIKDDGCKDAVIAHLRVGGGGRLESAMSHERKAELNSEWVVQFQHPRQSDTPLFAS